MIASKDNVARDLAESHVHAGLGVKSVYRLVAPNEDDQAEPVKLLEVNEDTVERGVEPIRFGPDPENQVLFASVVVDVSPREFEMILAGQLALPHNWKLGPKLIG